MEKFFARPWQMLATVLSALRRETTLMARKDFALYTKHLIPYIPPSPYPIPFIKPADWDARKQARLMMD